MLVTGRYWQVLENENLQKAPGELTEIGEMNNWPQKGWGCQGSGLTAGAKKRQSFFFLAWLHSRFLVPGEGPDDGPPD